MKVVLLHTSLEFFPFFPDTLAEALPGQWSGTERASCTRQPEAQAFGRLNIAMIRVNDLRDERRNVPLISLDVGYPLPPLRCPLWKALARQQRDSPREQYTAALAKCKQNPPPFPLGLAWPVSGLTELSGCVASDCLCHNAGNSRGTDHAGAAVCAL